LRVWLIHEKKEKGSMAIWDTKGNIKMRSVLCGRIQLGREDINDDMRETKWTFWILLAPKGNVAEMC
jgi:hypothetical protein